MTYKQAHKQMVEILEMMKRDGLFKDSYTNQVRAILSTLEKAAKVK